MPSPQVSNISQNVRVRFAPSPTGFLHVGGARTALFNWLFARGRRGQFVLRIEDTDRARSSDAMTAAIVDGMTWLGLDWDEGPTHQADGLARHRADAAAMLERGYAYRCFCTPDELNARRADDGQEGYRYDRHCLHAWNDEQSAARAAEGDPFVVRYRVREGTTAWDDEVHGRITFANSDIEDFIILRTDGTPIYNMAVVSDDVAMRITHVIRGDDHISNTPKQILLYQALGAPIPVFAHVPMILGPDGKRLSKRHGATAIGEYRAAGILPDAMVNFLALLGWSPGGDEEIMSRDRVIELFSLEAINRKSAVFDTRKLEWLNGQYISRLSAAEIAELLVDTMERRAGAAARIIGHERFERAVDLLKGRARTLTDLADWLPPYVDADFVYDEEAIARHWREPAAVATRLERLRDAFANLEAWQEADLEATLREQAESSGVGAGKLIHPLRVALLGQSVSPGIFEVLVALGRDASMRRIDRAIAALRKLAAEAGRDG